MSTTCTVCMFYDIDIEWVALVSNTKPFGVHAPNLNANSGMHAQSCRHMGHHGSFDHVKEP